MAGAVKQKVIHENSRRGALIPGEHFLDGFA